MHTRGAHRHMAALANIAAPLAIVEGDRITAVNAELAALAGVPAAQLTGRSVLSLIAPDQHDAIARDVEALAEDRLEGFQARRTFRVGGRDLPVRIWVRRIHDPELDDMSSLCVVVRDDEGADPLLAGVLAEQPVQMVMIVADHDWVVERVSADAARVLGRPAHELLGEPVLGLVHPRDATDFLASVAVAATSGRTLTCHLRCRTPPSTWRMTMTSVAALCEHDPPRLGLAVVRAGQPGDSRDADDLHDADRLEQAMRRIATEVRSVGVLDHGLPAVRHSSASAAAQLSSRQWQILERLIEGQSAAKIARDLYLSPSTVRNHLVAIYRKFGVHSQLELISALREGV